MNMIHRIRIALATSIVAISFSTAAAHAAPVHVKQSHSATAKASTYGKGVKARMSTYGKGRPS